MERIVGKHYAPPAVCFSEHHYMTVSVGVCKVLPMYDGKKTKLGKALVRVFGPNNPEGVKQINAMAEKIALALDNDAYNGPKTVRIQAG